MARRHPVFRFRPVRCGSVTRLGAHRRIALTDYPPVIIRRELRHRLHAILRGHLSARRKLRGQPVHSLSVDEMLAVCAPCQVISFDIFDTLLYRCVESGEDVFRLLEMQNGRIDFAARRRRAEADTRTSGETTLKAIYQHLAQQGTVEDADAAMEQELALEAQVCHAVEPMPALVKALKAAGKQIVVTSDMYLPAEFLSALLQQAGYPPFDRIFVSCEHGVGKAGGGLLAIVRQAMNTDSILHIGDNMVSDALGAVSAGIDAGYWANRPALCLTGDRSGTMTQSVHHALCAQRLSADVSPSYAVGYAVGGLITLGFCRQLQAWQKSLGWQKLFFAARDGWIMRQVYTRHFGPAEYLPISRAACQMLTAHQDTDAFVDNNFIARIGTGETFGDVLTGLGLSDCLPVWRDAVDPGEPVTKAGMARLKTAMHRDPGVIRACYAAAADDAWAYYAPLLAGCDRIGLADTGWKGSSGMQLNHFLHNRGMDITVVNALLGTSRSEAVRCQADAGRLVSYLYGPGHHQALMERQFRKGTIPCTVMEMLFAADLPPLLSYRQNGDDFTYGAADVSFADRIRQQQQGILDFADDFLAAEAAIGFTLPITPDDAYAPFDILTSDPDALLALWGDHVHGSSPTAHNREDTFADMLRRQHWISAARLRRFQQTHT